MKSKMKGKGLLLAAAFAVAGFAGCKKDEDMPDVATQAFKVTIENVSVEKDLFRSGVFNTPVGETSPGPAFPGSSYSFDFEAGPGQQLHFVTMFVQSNDLFYGPDGNGIELFDNGNPVTGDITNQILLWDAGTEVNEEPGVGANQPPRQSGPNTGPAENGTVRRISDVMDGFTYPSVSSTITTTLSYNGNNSFTLLIENLAGSTTPLAPGVFAVTSMENPMFVEGSNDLMQGLEALAEDGDAAGLGDYTAMQTGLASPLAPGAYALHNEGNPIFTGGAADTGGGLEALAEDGDPSGLKSSLGGLSEVSASDIFNTPDGASAAGPALPGASYSFSFTATQGDKLSFATMYVQSNDLFFGPKGSGLELWNGETPISGDITSQIQLWDAGTEVNELPGAGANQPPRQGGANTGAAENGTVEDIGNVNDGFSYPAVSDVIRVTISWL